MLRYVSEGEVHKDFHGLTCATLHYLIDNYGREAVLEVMRNTACKVYKTIHEGLQKGDCSELLEYWEYYLKRENGSFDIEKLGDEIRLTVKDCPALRHLVKLEQQPDKILCEATGIFNEALCEGSAYTITTESTGDFSCVQTLKKKERAADAAQ